MTKPTKPKVFISYAREDKTAASKIRDRLAELGAQPWIDSHDIRAGKSWKTEISKAIKDSDFFIALLSKSSVGKRGHVQKEIREALEIVDALPDDSVFIIPCRLDECKTSHKRLQELQRVDLFPSFEKGVKAISVSIKLQYASPFSSTNQKYGKSMSRRHLSLSLSEESKRRIDSLREQTGAASNTEILRRALSLFDAIARERTRGNELYFKNEAPNTDREFDLKDIKFFIPK